jgi:hypothetical protein
MSFPSVYAFVEPGRRYSAPRLWGRREEEEEYQGRLVARSKTIQFCRWQENLTTIWYNISGTVISVVSFFFGSTLQSHHRFSYLSSLQVGWGNCGHWVSCIDLLSRGSLTGWKRRVLWYRYNIVPAEFGPSFFFEELLRHTSTLEVLHLVGRCYADAVVMGRLHCSSPNLKELSASRTTVRKITMVDM